jgi:hypothetical protein
MWISACLRSIRKTVHFGQQRYFRSRSLRDVFETVMVQEAQPDRAASFSYEAKQFCCAFWLISLKPSVVRS